MVRVCSGGTVVVGCNLLFFLLAVCAHHEAGLV